MNLYFDMRVLQVDILCLAYRGTNSYSKPCILKFYLNNRLSIITTLKIGVQILKKLCLLTRCRILFLHTNKPLFLNSQ